MSRVNHSRRSVRPVAVVSFVILAISLSGTRALAQGASEGVPLMVWDTMVRPGNPWVLSIRTCQPRGISQAEILIRRPSKRLPTVEGTTVFSRENDAQVATFQPEDDAILTTFLSPSATVNTRHGPLLALDMAAEFDLVPGESFPMFIDANATWLLDERGEPATWTGVSGTIMVVEEDAPYVLAVGDAVSPPGTQALIPVGTFESVPLLRADMLIRYDPSTFPRVRDVVVWEYSEDTQAAIDDSVRGELWVSITSPSASVNLVHGPLIEISFQVDPGGADGYVALDRDATRLIDASGNPLELELRDGSFGIVKAQRSRR